MSYARNIRRRQQREDQPHLMMLGSLLGDFYEFLKQPQPTDNEVRSNFISSNNKWKKYCKVHKLMNSDHLFVLNVQEAWKRHTQQLPQNP